MSLSLLEKQHFYEQLGQLLQAGIPIKTALEKLSLTARGSLRTFLASLRQQMEGGATVGEAFKAARPALSEMEQATLGGLARSGQMERGLKQLSGYFEALQRARGQVLRRLGYPLFLLHFAVVGLNVPLLVGEGGAAKFMKATGTAFLVFYGAVAALAILVPWLLNAGAFLPGVDRMLRRFPLLGKIRRSFAVSRFCATYNMQLEAGINVMDSLQAAGKASRSGLIHAAVASALPELRHGAQVGTLLAPQQSAFPRQMLSAFLVAEETGQLDQALDRLTNEYQSDAFTRLETASEWVPRLLYVAIVIFVGWKTVEGYRSYLHTLDEVGSQLDSALGP